MGKLSQFMLPMEYPLSRLRDEVLKFHVIKIHSG